MVGIEIMENFHLEWSLPLIYTENWHRLVVHEDMTISTNDIKLGLLE